MLVLFIMARSQKESFSSMVDQLSCDSTKEVQTISQASKFLIQPADTRNPNYAMLSVTPRFTKGKTKISFILANGAVVNTQMLIVSKATPETVRFIL